MRSQNIHLLSIAQEMRKKYILVKSLEILMWDYSKRRYQIYLLTTAHNDALPPTVARITPGTI